ncbi:MAG: hypothetical protein AAFW47_07765 [Pseudomonadota bacterium]
MEKQRLSFIKKINSELPNGIKVIPWAMLPFTVWHGHQAGFLMTTCNRFPSSHENIFLLAGDDESSNALGLPRHPGLPHPSFCTACENLVSEVHSRFRAKHQKIGSALNSGQHEKATEMLELVDLVKRQVNGVAHGLTSELFGEDVYKRHCEVFGEILGWN